MRFIRGWLVATAAFSLAVGLSNNAFATDYTALVTTDTNDGVCGALDCSLRDGILVSNSTGVEDTINLGASTYTLSLFGMDDTAMNGDLDITEDLNIVGQGADVTVIDANRIDRVFHVIGAGVTVRFYDLTIRGGGNFIQSDLGGGGIRNEGGSVYLFNCNVVDNRTGSLSVEDNYHGGGLTNTDGGYMSITGSTIADNWAKGYAGGIANTHGGSVSILFMEDSTVSGNTSDAGWGGAGVYNSSTMDIRGSTISTNLSAGPIGGIWNVGNLTLDSCTITGNLGTALTTASNGVTTVGNTIVHGSCSTGNDATVTSSAGNLESPGDTCDFLDIFDMKDIANPMLSPLGDHGGPTETHVPVPGSPAIDRVIADANCRSFDQRGFERGQDGNNDGTATCDIGSVEYFWGEFIEGIFVDGFELGDTTAWSATTPWPGLLTGFVKVAGETESTKWADPPHRKVYRKCDLCRHVPGQVCDRVLSDIPNVARNQHSSADS